MLSIEDTKRSKSFYNICCLLVDHIDWSQIAIGGSLTGTQTSYDLELPEEVNQLGITNSVGAPIVRFVP